jgi:predicted house-cleaning noncanonical NTP pyrophosphatase (MazG superfamily)
MKAVSEQELKQRLLNKKSDEEIEDLIDRHVAASLEELPDMDIITELAQKSQEEKLLRVRFGLESEQYDALAAYFGEKDKSATVLAKKAIEEFISIIT